MSDRLRAGLIGSGIQLSRTPRMHMEEGRALGLDYHYALFDTESDARPLPDLLDQAEADGLAGVNITHPFKQAVLEHVDETSPSVTAIGAANTVVFRNGERFAHNTDTWGFARAFRQELSDVATGRVLLVGAGGAGLAVAHALMDCGVVQLVVHDVSPDAARSLEDSIAARFGRQRVCLAESLDEGMASIEGIVNATPVGMAAYPGTPVPTSLLGPELWVTDIIYFPMETAFLRAARAKGCRTMDGSGMAIFQAVRAFELFAGMPANPERMRATFASFDAS